MDRTMSKYLVKDGSHSIFEADCIFACMDIMRDGRPTRKLFMVDGDSLILLAFRKPLFEHDDSLEPPDEEPTRRRRR